MNKSVIAIMALLCCIPPILGKTSHSSDGLIIGLNAAPVSLDPAVITDYETAKVTTAIFEGLVRYKADSTAIEPCLATSWNVSKDGTVWEFNLRRNVLFHDGTPFNAQAVVFSISRQIDHTHPYYNKNSKYARFTFGTIAKLEAKSSHNLIITLKQPYSPFLANLAMPMAAPIVSPSAVLKYKDEFDENPVGTGPYIYNPYENTKQNIRLHRNDDYWDAGERAQELIFRRLTNPAFKVEEFHNQRVHIIDNIRPMDVMRINQNGKATIIRHPGLNVAYLAMNNNKPPFHMEIVRKAINHAINKKNLIRLIYQEFAIVAKNPIPPIMWGYNNSIKDYEYAPAIAKKMLEEAGYPNGFETTLYVMTAPRPYMPSPLELAKTIQTNLATLGIRAQIMPFQWKEYLQRVDNGEHDMCLLGWVGDNGDPDNFLYTLLDGSNILKPTATNRAFFSNNESHELMLKAQHETDREKRAQLYKQVQVIIHEKAPWVPLAHVEQVAAISKNVVGIIYHPTGAFYYNNAHLR